MATNTSKKTSGAKVTTVKVRPIGEDRFEIRFSYNPQVVEILKDSVGYDFRRWNPGPKFWTITTTKALEGFVKALIAEGIQVEVEEGPATDPGPRSTGYRSGPSYGPGSSRSQQSKEEPKRERKTTHSNSAGGTWAMEMLTAAPEALRPKLYKKLSTVLHPDAGGDEAMMKALNAAATSLKLI